MKIVIIGAGAVGGVIAAYLSSKKQEVELVCKHKQTVETIENNGLRVEGIKGQLITYPDTVIDISQISDKPEIVLLATKIQDVEDVARTVVPFLKDDTMVVSLQNGICEDRIAEIVGRHRTIGCVVEWGATLLGPGRVYLSSNGTFTIGELNGEITPRLAVLRSILEKVFPVNITGNIYGALYSKLIVNSCITTLGAISGLYLGEMLNMRIARTIFLRVFTEAVAVANAAGFKLEKVANKLDPYKFALTKKELNSRLSLSLLKKHLIIILIGFKYRKLKSSSLQSLERDRPTEIDYINGYIVNKAKEYNISVPINTKLVSMIKEIEQGKRRIELENFYNIL